MAKWMRYAPPGVNLDQLKNFTFYSLTFCILLSMFLFGNRLQAAHAALFDHITGELTGTLTGWDFIEILNRGMMSFSLVAIAHLALVLSNYLYFFEGSKSIYTMARVKSPWELHIRCWTLPVCGALLLLVCRVILTVLYFLIFLLATPKGIPMPGFYQLIGGLLQ